MKMTIADFDQFGTSFIRAVRQDDTAVVMFGQTLKLPQQQLYEVWYLPSHEAAFTESFLAQAGFRDVKELLELYKVEESPWPLHAATKEIELLTAFSIDLDMAEVVFDFSLQPTKEGEVISVVFGTRSAMNAMYSYCLRRREVEEVDDEPSM